MSTTPATVIDSAVFGDIFSTAPMRSVFSDANRVQKYLDFEAALAWTQARLGIIPRAAAEEIVRHCRAGEVDFVKLKQDTERIGYPVLPVVQQLVALCRDGHGEWCHWGATTQDVTDSATVLQIREARSRLADVQAAGAVFLGNWSPESMGDYCSGPNHTLPTYGHAKAHSGLSLEDFQKRISVQELTPAGLRGLSGTARVLAALEGLDAHAASITIRLDALAEMPR